MGKKSGWASVAAEGINGYLRGMQITRGMEREDEEKAYREEQRNNARQDREDKVQEKRQLQDAARPVEVIEGAGGMTKPETADNRDVGQPGDVGMAAGGLHAGSRVAGTTYTDPAAASAAAVSANTPDAVAGRQAGVLRAAGKPMEAAQLESATVQGKAARFTLDKAQQDFINEKFDKQLMAVSTPQQLADVLSKSPLVQGKEVSIVKSEDGKKNQLMMPGPDGTMVKFGAEFGDSPKDITAMMTKFSQSMTPAQKIQGSQWLQQYEEQQRQFNETKKMQADQFAENKRLQEKQIGISGAHLGIAQEQSKRQGELHTFQVEKAKRDSAAESLLPPAVKLVYASQSKVLDAAIAARLKAQADNTWDPNSKNGIEMLAQEAKYTNDINKLITPYLPKGAEKPPYPGGAAGGTKGAGAPTTADGKAVAAAPPGAVMRQPDGSYKPPVAGAAAGIPAPAPAAAQPAVDPLLKALGATGNSSIDQIVAQKAAPLREAAAVVQQAKQALAQVAQDPARAQQAAQALQQARNQFDAFLKDMQPQQADAVRAAAGVL
jgi:hypothetical protein